jgi:hypothetical protein
MVVQAGATPPRVAMAAGPDPSAILARARQVIGFAVAKGRVLHVHAATAVEQPYQSDRTYPPFFSNFGIQDTWFAVDTRVQRVHQTDFFPGTGPTAERVFLDDGLHAAIIQAGKTVPIHRRQAESRYLDAWAVVADWSAAPNVHVVGTENFRDYPRVVLERRTSEGEQRLFIDPKSGYPVKLDLIEPHYLWGQRHVEYVWSTWIAAGGVSYPGAVFRLADGEVEYSRTNGDAELIPSDSAPPLTPPEPPAQVPAELPMFLQPLPPEPVKVAEDVWLLSNRGYREAVAEAAGEIFVFDTTQGEARARQDAELIRKIFPGTHKINVVVTDLAWPHIAGLRFWVAQGATIISHRASHEFLQRVIDREWTLAPDLLEQLRAKDPKSIRLDFVAIDRPTDYAAGRVRIVPIDGVASEVALLAYLPIPRFLWASDYIQTVDSPSQYAREVMDAAERSGIDPERVAAEHLPLTAWSDVVKAQRVPVTNSHVPRNW